MKKQIKLFKPAFSKLQILLVLTGIFILSPGDLNSCVADAECGGNQSINCDAGSCDCVGAKNEKGNCIEWSPGESCLLYT